MSLVEQPIQQFTVTAVCTISDPVERKRRLAQAYDLILAFGRRSSPEAKAEPPGPDGPAH